MDIARRRDDDVPFYDTTLTYDEVLTQLEKNDPFFKTLGVWIHRVSLEARIQSSDEIHRVCRAIARSTSLETLFLCVYEGEEQLKIFELLCQNLGENNSIYSLEFSFTDAHVFEFASAHMRSFFENNVKLKSLAVKSISSFCHKEIMNFVMMALEQRRNLFSFEKIDLTGCKIGDNGVKELVDFFGKHPGMTPKSICLSGNDISDDGCISISKIISNTACMELEAIDLQENRSIGISGLQFIATALGVRQHPLRLLDLRTRHRSDRIIFFTNVFSFNLNAFPDIFRFGFRGIDNEGLRELGSLIVRRNSPLEELYMNSVGRCDGYDGFVALVDAFLEYPGKTPKTLKLSELDDRSSRSIWRKGNFEVAQLLQRPNCSLENLHIYDNFSPDDDDLDVITTCLVVNKVLRELHVDLGTPTSFHWARFCSVLCDKRSIESTYFTSNHTLIKLGRYSTPPATVQSYLQLNKYPDKRFVACVKVIENHFARNFDMGLVEEMPASVLAEVISFVDRGFRAWADYKITESNISFDEDDFASGDDRVDEHENDAVLSSKENNALTVHFLIIKSNPAVFDTSLFEETRNER